MPRPYMLLILRAIVALQGVAAQQGDGLGVGAQQEPVAVLQEYDAVTRQWVAVAVGLDGGGPGKQDEYLLSGGGRVG